MDQVVLADNDPAQDTNHEKGVVVFKDDQETHRFTGDSTQGDLEAVTADGRVIALHVDAKSVDFLQLTEKPDGVEALHQHYNRDGGGWMQVGGAVEVTDLDDPQAIGNIFKL